MPCILPLLVAMLQWKYLSENKILRFPFYGYCNLFYSLSGLESFIITAETSLGQRVEEGDYETLVGVLGHLLAIKERQRATDDVFEPLKQTFALLKDYEQELPDAVHKQLEVRTPVIPSPPMNNHPSSIFSFRSCRKSGPM